jgi:hypothetical protein
MFRLWFMTFFGEYRGETDAAHGHDPHGTSDAQERTATVAFMKAQWSWWFRW